MDPSQSNVQDRLNTARPRICTRANHRTVASRVAALDPRLTMAKRPGTKAARQKFGPVGVSNLRADAPLDLLQIDHTLVDVIVVDREHRLAIGRPWLTLAIDIATGRSLGLAFR